MPGGQRKAHSAEEQRRATESAVTFTGIRPEHGLIWPCLFTEKKPAEALLFPERRVQQNEQRVKFQSPCKHTERKQHLDTFRHPAEVVHCSYAAEARSGVGKAGKHGGKTRQKIDAAKKQYARAYKKHEQIGDEEHPGTRNDLFRKGPVLKTDG